MSQEGGAANGITTADNPLGEVGSDITVRRPLPSLPPVPLAHHADNDSGEAGGAQSPRSRVDIPGWLNKLRERSALGQRPGGATPVWGLVFELSPAPQITDECRVLAEKIVDAGLVLNFFFSRDIDEIFLTVGATTHVLAEEAELMQMPLRLKYRDPSNGEIAQDGRTMKGCVPFRQSLQKFYAGSSDIAHLDGVEFFSSGSQQQLVAHRITRLVKIDLEMRILMPPRKTLLAEAKLCAKPLSKKRRMQAFRLMQLAESFGCTLGASEVAMRVYERLPRTVALYEQWVQMSPSMKIDVEDFRPMLDELTDIFNREEGCGGAVNAQGKRTLRGLSSLCEFFPIHEQVELSFLQNNWGTFSCIWSELLIYDSENMAWFGPHYQPLREIRDYMGEHVALYFAWMGLYTRSLVAPALLGLLTMLGYGLWDDDTNPLALVYSVFLSLWSTFLLARWHRLENELKFEWGSEGFEQAEVPRPAFRGMFVRDEHSGIEKLVRKTGLSRWRRFGRLGISWLTVLSMIFLTGVAATNAYVVRELYDTPPADNNTRVDESTASLRKKIFNLSSSFLSLFAIQLASRVYKRLAIMLTDWENHRTQTEYDDALIIKNFLFEFINNYFSLFFIAFLLHLDVPDIPEVMSTISDEIDGVSFPQQHLTACPGTSCMGVLQRQLFVVFTCKQIGQQLKQAVKPWLMHKRRMAKENQGIVQANKLRPAHDQISLMISNVVEYQRLTEPYKSSFDDFKEMSIQFGYVTLFAVSYPLAALLAYLNNLSELRLDAYQVCHVHRRPRWRSQEDIGSWGTVFHALSVTNVITNACLIGFVGSQLATLLEPGNESSSFVQRVKMWKMWLIVTGVEHAVFLTKFFITTLSSATPEWIDDAKNALRLRQETDLAAAEGVAGGTSARARATEETLRREVLVLQRQLEKAAQEEGAGCRGRSSALGRRMSVVSGSSRRRTKSAKASDALLEDPTPAPPPESPAGMEQVEAQRLRMVWEQLDSDGSGLLNGAEVRQVMKQMGVSQSDHEFSSTMTALDTDGSGELDFDEFLQWWLAQDTEAQKQLMQLQQLSFADL